MRKIYFLIVVFAVMGISFSSCKKDAVKEAPKPVVVVGIWNTKTITNDYYYNGNFVGTESGPTANNYVDNIEFKNDGTGTMSVNGAVYRKFNYSVVDSSIYYTSVFVYVNKQLTSQGNFKSVVTKLNGNELGLSQDDYFFTKTMWQNTIPIDRVKTTLSFVK